MKKKVFLFIILLNFINLIFSEINYKISGRTIFNGKGTKNNLVKCERLGGQNHFIKNTYTDEEGKYYFYIPRGKYALTVTNLEGLVSSDPYKIITLENKNIKNIIFILERGCTISGFVKFKDNTPIEGVTVAVYNERCGLMEYTNKNGFYKIDSIVADEDTKIKVSPMIAPPIETLSGINLVEGQIIENFNFSIEKKLSLKGKITNKDTNESIIDIDIPVWGEKGLVVGLNSNKNGEFNAYNLKKGRYLIQIYETGYKFYKKEIEIKKDEQIEILIELEREVENE